MKYIDEFRDKKLVTGIAAKLKGLNLRTSVNIMEVCGTHTQNFYRFGLIKFIPSNINFISGPGCPVCVSSNEYIDTAINCAKIKDAQVFTFGDMVRVPGSKISLEEARAAGADVNLIYSPLQALEAARRNPKKKIIFLGVGFETTAPAVALSIIKAKKEKIENFFVLSSLKLIPPAMEFLLQDPRLNLSGFLCPGHVSAIIGSRAYDFIARNYRVPCCVAGFEPLDILEGIYFIARQIVSRKAIVKNQYIRVVRPKGNPKAKQIIGEVFKISDSSWRGLGVIPASGLEINKKYAKFDAERIFLLKKKINIPASGNKGCRCAEVLKGIIRPDECRLFKKICSPEHPQGPCMVSFEGACNVYFKFKKG